MKANKNTKRKGRFFIPKNSSNIKPNLLSFLAFQKNRVFKQLMLFINQTMTCGIQHVKKLIIGILSA
jgi:hypothetical protein